jgi:hypothetical protein
VDRRSGGDQSQASDEAELLSRPVRIRSASRVIG